MPTYDPTGHPLLSAAAAALAQDELDAQADAAEAAFGIAGTAYTGEDAAALTLAVAMQVNRAVLFSASGGGLYKSESKGSQSYTLADQKDLEPTDSAAAAIVARVTRGARVADWPLAGSLR